MLFVIFIMLHNMLNWSTQNMIPYTASAINQRKTGFYFKYMKESGTRQGDLTGRQTGVPHLNVKKKRKKCNSGVCEAA